jgi:hypothetical protein
MTISSRISDEFQFTAKGAKLLGRHWALNRKLPRPIVAAVPPCLLLTPATQLTLGRACRTHMPESLFL